MYQEDDYLMISGLQHFQYCRRQWALIHIEQQWAENGRTTDGKLFHKTAHDSTKIEKRNNKIIIRNLKIKSAILGVSGECDIVEFNKNENGINLFNYDGKWIPVPIEYKSGEPKENNADELQLCCQAICLEEMLCCKISEGYLFYGKTKRRKTVEFTESLREMVHTNLREMHHYMERGWTPGAKRNKGCNACSLKELCIPALEKCSSVNKYIEEELDSQ